MREEILDFLKSDIEGPCYESGCHEHIINQKPIHQFITGILEPFDRTLSGEKGIILGDNDESNESITRKGDDSGQDGFAFNNYTQSSLGYSFFLHNGGGKYEINLKFSTYIKIPGSLYQRVVHDFRYSLDRNNIPTPGKSLKIDVLDSEGNPVNLRLMMFNKSGIAIKENREVELLTLSVVHTKEKDPDELRPDWNDCYYQVTLYFNAISGALIAPYIDRSAIRNQDDELNSLLYRNVYSFALGHGCAVEWNLSDKPQANYLKSTFIPKYDLKPLIHNSGQVKYRMYLLSNSGWENGLNLLNSLHDEYSSWILKKEDEIDSLDSSFINRATENMSKCRDTLNRIKKGIHLVKENKEVKLAFQLMNEAMLNQQLRSSLKRTKYSQGIRPELPLIDDESTWPLYDKNKGESRLGKWRIFQLAFILLNLDGIVNEDSESREVLDLIWFPTGGGKTEAYLGLSAFTIFFNKLTGRKNGNTEVLMRYTLKLLTAQQFERACALVSQMELIRASGNFDLGSEKITIGLWVGGGERGLSPNTHQQAKKYFEDISSSANYKFILTKCPCCSREMGYIDSLGEIKGLEEREGKIIFTCYSGCEYDSQELPVMVVDEYQYIKPPTILIATVDKFTQLSWRSSGRKFLGVDVPNHGEFTPPSLIIQDELHLISGPLGSVVGHYEPLFDIYCDLKSIPRPKVIASTATIAMAEEQIKALYGKPNNRVNIFPNPGLDFKDSFFAKYDNTGEGRRYVGVFANNSPSYKTTQYRIWSALLAAGKAMDNVDDNERNAYYTLLCYFNSLKDLGHARTLFNDDVPRHLKDISQQQKWHVDKTRVLNDVIELTSDVESGEIPERMKVLGQNYPNCLDVCLASNMISVGLDIPRLSLMTILSQPKSTAEYIQASSRIGRGQYPGIIFNIFNTGRARDRSHFEHFIPYHSRIYASVEPSGITPYSSKVIKRALAGMIVAYVRCHPDQKQRDHADFGYPTKEMIDSFIKYMKARSTLIDSNETDKLIGEIQHLFKLWKIRKPDKYGDIFNIDFKGPVPLMIPYGKRIPDFTTWTAKPMNVLASMRSIDSVSQIIYQTPNS